MMKPSPFCPMGLGALTSASKNSFRHSLRQISVASLKEMSSLNASFLQSDLMEVVNTEVDYPLKTNVLFLSFLSPDTFKFSVVVVATEALTTTGACCTDDTLSC